MGAKKKKKKKKKKKGSGDEATPSAPSAPAHISRPFADALRGMKVAADPKPAKKPPKKSSRLTSSATKSSRAKPKSSVEHTYEDRAAFNVAYADVSPLGAKQRGDRTAGAKRADSAVAPRVGGAERALGAGGELPEHPQNWAAEADAAARARLASLVTDGLRFEVRREEDWVEGRREDAPRSRLADLRSGRATPDAEIDLHGMTGDEAIAALVKFVRREKKRGREIVRVIHGKGLHSSGGVGVLADRVLSAITRGPLSPMVHAFITTAIDSGGSGALLIRLETR